MPYVINTNLSLCITCRLVNKFNFSDASRLHVLHRNNYIRSSKFRPTKEVYMKNAYKTHYFCIFFHFIGFLHRMQDTVTFLTRLYSSFYIIVNMKSTKFYSDQLMHFFIQLCISLLSYIKITYNTLGSTPTCFDLL